MIKSAYKSKAKLDLKKFKNGDIQATKVDLNKININTLAKKAGVLSENVKMYMYPSGANIYYALNDRTINLLMKGNVDMSATTGKKEQELELFIVDKHRTRGGGSFFPYLNITIFDLSKYGMFKTVDRNNYRHNCLYLALQAGGLSDVKLQELILSLRNRHIHKCDLENVCNTLEIHIELISLRNDGETNRVEHYGKEYDGKYNSGLVEGHYFMIIHN